MEELKEILLEGIDSSYRQMMSELEFCLRDERACHSEILTHFIKLIGLDKFSYVHATYNLDSLTNVNITGNYPQEWVRIYALEKMYKADPVMLNSSQRRFPFFWQKSTFTEWNYKVFNQSSEHGIGQGYTIPLHEPGFTFGSFHLASCEDNKDFKDAVKMKKRVIYTISCLAHEYTPFSYIPSDAPVLTARELETLYWSSHGKTYSEISLILKISERTVKFHSGNIVKKLNTNNMRQAVSKAIRAGYL